MYETFEHTADLGLRVRAASLEDLFVEAGRGLFSILVENIEAIGLDESVEIAISGTDTDYLLFDWLSELLFQFETQQQLFGSFKVTLTDQGLTAVCRGEKIDRARHHLSHEVKAVTYHGLRVVQAAVGWEAEVIVDI
jgi:SHS2 domain-containing protein